MLRTRARASGRLLLRRLQRRRRNPRKNPPPKLTYDKTEEDLDESVHAELDRQIFKAPKPRVEKPIDQVNFHHFMRKMEEERRRKPDEDFPNPLSDYDRQVLKTQRGKKKPSSKVPELGN
jgi:hypothetical protein